MSKTGGKKAALPELLETPYENRNQAVLWLERALDLKTQIGVEPDEKEGVEGSGMLRDLYEVKDRLAIYTAENGVEGIRHDKIVFMCTPRAGRTIVVIDKLRDYLLEHGVDAKLIGDAIEAATKQSDSYYVREISRLK